MKVRIKFAKYGTMKFIGHLDLMRYFQKLFRRSKIGISFTEGMSPHMILSFAAPLSLGAEGFGEYADIGLDHPICFEEARTRLNELTVEGIEFLDMHEIPDGKAGKAMSLVSAADYAVRIREGHAPVGEELLPGGKQWQAMWRSFLEQPAILVEKETKKGTRETDIRPMIYGGALGKPFAQSACAARKDFLVHSEYPIDKTLYLRLATGSAANLKPETVMEAYFSYACGGDPKEKDPFAVQTSRLELYAEKEQESLAGFTDAILADQTTDEQDAGFIALSACRKG